MTFGREKRLLQVAFSLSRFMKARYVFFKVPQDVPFLVGKRVALDFLPGNFARPFVFVAQDHAFTGGVIAGLIQTFSFFPYLLVLDAHLDLFSSCEASFPIHRGNFLAYLLKRGKFPEDRLLVCSDIEAFDELVQRLSTASPGPLYLSWDVDFGFPEVACFPGKAFWTRLEEFFSALAFHLRKQGLRFFGGDLVELDPGKIHDPLELALRVFRCLLPLLREEERP